MKWGDIVFSGIEHSTAFACVASASVVASLSSSAPHVIGTGILTAAAFKISEPALESILSLGESLSNPGRMKRSSLASAEEYKATKELCGIITRNEKTIEQVEVELVKGGVKFSDIYLDERLEWYREDQKENPEVKAEGEITPATNESLKEIAEKIKPYQTERAKRGYRINARERTSLLGATAIGLAVHFLASGGAIDDVAGNIWDITDRSSEEIVQVVPADDGANIIQMKDGKLAELIFPELESS